MFLCHQTENTEWSRNTKEEMRKSEKMTPVTNQSQFLSAQTRPILKTSFFSELAFVMTETWFLIYHFFFFVIITVII